MARVQARVTLFAEPIEVDEDELPHLRASRILVENDDPPKDKPAPSGKGASSGHAAGKDGA